MAGEAALMASSPPDPRKVSSLVSTCTLPSLASWLAQYSHNLQTEFPTSGPDVWKFRHPVTPLAVGGQDPQELESGRQRRAEALAAAFKAGALGSTRWSGAAAPTAPEDLAFAHAIAGHQTQGADLER